MPLYEYSCSPCNEIWSELRPVDERNGATCKKCGGLGSMVFSASDVKPKYSWVRGWWDNIDTNPIFIEDKDHLLRECGKRNLVPKAFGKREDTTGGGVRISNAYRGRR